MTDVPEQSAAFVQPVDALRSAFDALVEQSKADILAAERMRQLLDEAMADLYDLDVDADVPTPPQAPALDRYYLIGTDEFGEPIFHADPRPNGEDHGAIEYVRADVACGLAPPTA